MGNDYSYSRHARWGRWNTSNRSITEQQTREYWLFSEHREEMGPFDRILYNRSYNSDYSCHFIKIEGNRLLHKMDRHAFPPFYKRRFLFIDFIEMFYLINFIKFQGKKLASRQGWRQPFLLIQM
ncbi:hypothetical protein [Paenibacillus sp. GCM10027626]|uniref:hypothetical protein n=1 Tax=Paenibacillus sp. GCM10027626 TaxID=3273411 RepID=UPI00362F77A7